jgi:DNA-binding transcriptional MerR regulator
MKGGDAMRQAMWTVGRLSKATGVSVRTLHHYDQIGLLSPSGRTDAGYRLYASGDIARLQRIRSLRDLGFSLGEIAALLDRPDLSPRRVVELHIRRLQERMTLERALCRRLEALAAHLAGTEDVSVDEFIQTIEVMTMVDKFQQYYTPDQLSQLEERAAQVGPQRMAEVQEEWPRLIAEVRAEMDRGTPPTDERVLALARRWRSLVEEFTGGDPGIAASLQRMYENEPDMVQTHTGGADMMAYIREAMSREQ